MTLLDKSKTKRQLLMTDFRSFMTKLGQKILFL